MIWCIDDSGLRCVNFTAVVCTLLLKVNQVQRALHVLGRRGFLVHVTNGGGFKG